MAWLIIGFGLIGWELLVLDVVRKSIIGIMDVF